MPHPVLNSVRQESAPTHRDSEVQRVVALTSNRRGVGAARKQRHHAGKTPPLYHNLQRRVSVVVFHFSVAAKVQQLVQRLQLNRRN